MIKHTNVLLLALFVATTVYAGRTQDWLVAVRRTRLEASEGFVYVSPKGANVYPYNTWKKAANNIHDGVTIAKDTSLNLPTTLFVSNGLYRTTETIVIDNGIQMLGASPDPADVVLHPLNTGYHVLTASGVNTLVAGFTLKGGGGTGNYTPRALLIESGSSVSNCFVTANSGGISVHLYGTMSDSVVSSNGAYGRAIRVYTGGLLQDSEVSHNTAIENVMQVDDGSTVRRCVLHNNWSSSYGHNFDVLGVVENSIIRNNSVAGNFSAGVGLVGANARLDNCVVYANTAIGASSGGAGVLRIAGLVRNTVMLDNVGTVPFDYSGAQSAVFNSRASLGDLDPLQGNISAQPRFRDVSAFDFRLDVGSPCIDTGTNLASVTTDFFGTPRPLEGGTLGGLFHDMGVYELDSASHEFAVGFHGVEPLRGVSPFSVVFKANVVGAGTNDVWYGWDFNKDGTNDLAGYGMNIVTNSFDVGLYSICVSVSNDLGAAAEYTNTDYVSAISEFIFVATNGLHIYPYTNWANASTNIHDAIDLILDGATVYVGSGDFPLTKRILVGDDASIIGQGPEQTLLYRDATAGNFTALSIESANAFISGFAVSNGFGTSDAAAGIDMHGGVASNVLVRSSVGVQVYNAVQVRSGARMTHSSIISNVTYNGGVRVLAGGVIEDSLIGWNYGTDQGGLHLAGTGSRLRIVNNTAHGSFGPAGVTVAGGTLENSLIAGNRHGGAASPGGVQLSSGLVGSCTVVANSNSVTSTRGSGMWQSAGTVLNTIIYSNTGGTNDYTTTGGTITFSLAPELATGSPNNNLNGDPDFVGGGDYSLTLGSIAIDVGTNQAWMVSSQDLAGEDRIINDIVDMGAYEFAP